MKEGDDDLDEMGEPMPPEAQAELAQRRATARLIQTWHEDSQADLRLVLYRFLWPSLLIPAALLGLLVFFLGM